MKRFPLLLALCCLMFPIAAGATGDFPPAALPLIPGIDVSEYQGEIDFQRVRASGVEAVYIRSSLGYSFEDPDFVRNAENALAAGLRVGFYHFMTADSTEQALAEATFFARTIAGHPYTMRPAMDYGGGNSLDNDAFNEAAAAFLSRVEALTGTRPAIYSDASGARDRYEASLAVYPLWVADYGAASPEPNGKWAVWAGWQYADDGDIPGIEGNVDLDHFTTALFVNPSPTPTAAPTAVPSPTPTCPPPKPTSPCPIIRWLCGQ